MNYIKEVCEVKNGEAYRHIIRTDTYAHSAGHIARLAAQAIEDAGAVSPDECEVVFYGGRQYKRTIGLEFEWSAPLPGYHPVAQTELTL